MKKQTVKAAVIEFLGSFVITIVCCWSLYSIKENQLSYLGHALINGMILASLIWVAVVESGSHFNPIITIGKNLNSKSKLGFVSFPLQKGLFILLFKSSDPSSRLF